METYFIENLIPAYSSCFNYGWNTMKRDFLRLFLIILALGLVSLPMAMMKDTDGIHSAGLIILNVIGVSYTFLIYPVFSFSAKYLFLQSTRMQMIDFKEMLKGFDNYLNIILANLLAAGLIAIAFVALIVPGIIVACRLVFVPYLVMDKNLDPVDAVEESWRMTRGLAWTVFGMGISSIFIFLGGIVCLFVGIFPALIWINTSFAALYQARLQQNGEMNGNGDGNGLEVNASETQE